MVSTRAKERKTAFRILKRLATNPTREDQTSKLDYQKIQEDIANKRERSMEEAHPGSKKAKIINRGTWSRSFAEVVKDRKIIGVIDQSDEGGRIPSWTRTQIRYPIAQMQGGTRATKS